MQKIDWHILRKSMTGELTDKEKSELQGWLEESGENKRYYRKMQGFFARGRSEEIDVRKNFRQFERKTYGKRRYLVSSGLKYAAVVLLLIGSVGLWWELKSGAGETEGKRLALSPGEEKAVLYTGDGKKILLESQWSRNIAVTDSLHVRQDSNVLNYATLSGCEKKIEEIHTMQVPRGGEFAMKLSDGTMVYLNSETNLRYPVQFHGEERRVILSGEAYFDVTKSDKPFIVEVDDYEVRVLGTRFNVQAYKGESFETTLEQGSVEVEVNARVVLLKPGEQAVVTEEGELSKQKVDVRRYTAWKDGQFVFDDERLEDVMNTVARWYDIKVFYRNPEVKDIRINGNISRYKDFSVLLEKIEKLEIVYFDIKGNVITVIGK